MTVNSIEYKGITRTRKGKAYSHAVVTISDDNGRGMVEWASSRELAEKRAAPLRNRVALIKAGRESEVRGIWNIDWHRHVVEVAIVPVTHA